MVILKTIHQIRNERKYKYKKTITQKESCIQFINEETNLIKLIGCRTAEKRSGLPPIPCLGNKQLQRQK